MLQKNRNLTRTLLAMFLSVAVSGCIPEHELAFKWPLDGGVLGATDATFVIKLPGTEDPTIYLDGELVDPSQWTRFQQRVEGSLAGIEPGPHTLRVTYPIAGPLRSEAETSFEIYGAASFKVRGSLEQVFVTGAEPGQALVLYDTLGGHTAEATADYQGSHIFREVKPFDGYAVASGDGSEISPAVEVRAVEGSVPPQEFYEAQTLEPGFGYLTMRDGTKLSVYVQLPGPVEDGPYPTLVNYSGYSPSEPAGSLPISGIDVTPFCGDFPVLCDPPNHPSGIIAGVFGYATVGVNMRGTGCSGGAYDFFEPLQVTDGYDIIEAVAAQDWVRHNEVGMIGISFPGISQLFTAQANPPSLAAITPLSVISGADTTLGPGGIINDGFAVEWATQVLNRADPYGQGWEQGQVDGGDTICEENQLLHSQKVDIIEKAFENQFYTPEIYDPLNPRSFVDRIDVPVFTVGQWQDEQTGGHFPDLWNRFENAPLLRFTGLNGAHADGFSPVVLAEWKNFLDFYVAKEVRPTPFLIQIFAPLLFDAIFGAPVAVPPDRFTGMSYEDALAAYEAEPQGRILLEMGGGDAAPGAPEPRFEFDVSEWPPPSTVAERWYLHEDGSLSPVAPAVAESASTFQHDNEKGQETYDVNGSFERALTDIQWLPWQEGRQAVWLSEPLLADKVLLGHASADLWIQSTAEDADLEVMLSEVRPDGQESYITSGWLRASRRKLDAAESTELKPKQTHLEADQAPLPAGQWELVRVEIYPFAHVLRAGSQLRMSVATPGSNKGRWKFDVLQFEEDVTHSVSHSAAHPSSVVLPVIPGVAVPGGLSACPGLRGQYCRDYVPHTNALAD